MADLREGTDLLGHYDACYEADERDYKRKLSTRIEKELEKRSPVHDSVDTRLQNIEKRLTRIENHIRLETDLDLLTNKELKNKIKELQKAIRGQ